MSIPHLSTDPLQSLKVPLGIPSTQALSHRITFPVLFPEIVPFQPFLVPARSYTSWVLGGSDLTCHPGTRDEHEYIILPQKYHKYNILRIHNFGGQQAITNI